VTEWRVGMEIFPDLFWDSGTANTSRFEVSSVNLLQFQACYLLQALRQDMVVLIYYKI